MQDAEFRLNLKNSVYLRSTVNNWILSAYRVPHLAKPQNVNGKGREIFKDPVTDDGTKKSAKGLLAVFNGVLKDQCTWDEVRSEENELKVLFKDGEFLRVTTLTEIRQKLNG